MYKCKDKYLYFHYSHSLFWYMNNWTWFSAILISTMLKTSAEIRRILCPNLGGDSKWAITFVYWSSHTLCCKSQPFTSCHIYRSHVGNCIESSPCVSNISSLYSNQLWWIITILPHCSKALWLEWINLRIFYELLQGRKCTSCMI